MGTASWSDPGFVEHWYPKGMPPADRLPWYAQRFEMVEVNSTFYAVPDARMVERWIRATPEGFIFDLKLHQLLSRHATAAKLLPPALRRCAEVDARGKVLLTPAIEEAIVREILRAAEQLRGAGRLGTLLLQLSPAFAPRQHRLAELAPLLDRLSPHRVAVEFRNRNWVQGERLSEMVEFLRVHSAALVSVDTPAEDHFTIMPPELDEITNPKLAYLRLHGRDLKAYTTGKTVAARFNYDYNDEEIAGISGRCRKLAQAAQEVHVVFNNNALDYAPHAALRLRAALQQIAQGPARQPEFF